MKERALKDCIAIVLLASHFWIVALCFGLFAVDGRTFEQLTTLLAAVLPPVAVYTTAVVSYYADSRYRQRAGKAVNHVYAFIAVSFPVAYMLSLTIVIVLPAMNLGPDFKESLSLVVVIESAFGVYAAKIVQSMFSPVTV